MYVSGTECVPYRLTIDGGITLTTDVSVEFHDGPSPMFPCAATYKILFGPFSVAACYIIHCFGHYRSLARLTPRSQVVRMINHSVIQYPASHSYTA